MDQNKTNLYHIKYILLKITFQPSITVYYVNNV
jgi:hypothetical protein